VSVLIVDDDANLASTWRVAERLLRRLRIWGMTRRPDVTAV